LTSLMRIPMGFHFFSDILCGVALGAGLVLASQKLPIRCLAFKILKLQRKRWIAFCVTMFIATHSFCCRSQRAWEYDCSSGPRFFRYRSHPLVLAQNVSQNLSR